MPAAQNKKMIIAKGDHDRLSGYLKTNKVSDAMLQMIERAEQIDDAEFPWEVVRLNSRVIIRDKIVRLNYSYMVVMPELANHKECKVSVFSEIGSALFGKSRGNDIYWETPKGKRYFTIMAVSQYDFK